MAWTAEDRRRYAPAIQEMVRRGMLVRLAATVDAIHPPSPVGRPRVWPTLVMLQALWHVARDDRVWRRLPPGSPPHRTVRSRLMAWRRGGPCWTGRCASWLRRAAECLPTLRTPEGAPLLPNTLAELRRDLARLRLILDQIKAIEATRLERLEQQPREGPHAMVRLLARVIGVGVETADMLVHEALARQLRDRKAVAHYAGLTGSPDESGARRREKGLAKAGNTRVRRGMIQLVWRFVTTGEAPEGVALRPAT
jgi:hypothetical protein